MAPWERIAYPLARAILTVWFTYLTLFLAGIIH
jgi:hypothetical protein